MNTRSLANDRITLHEGDCLTALRAMPAASIDAIVTDPPYGLGFMGRAWDAPDNIAFRVELWAEALRVLKPGGHVLAFSGTRTYHRMAVAIEDAGFEIRDQLGWLYGTGFPKSLDVSKAIDKALGAEGSFGDPKSAAHASAMAKGVYTGKHEGWHRPWMEDADAVDRSGRRYLPGSPEAAAWDGWGTALKPAWEPVCMARKPLDGTVAANVMAHGTGGLNVDSCRIGTDTIKSVGPEGGRKFARAYDGSGANLPVTVMSEHTGRWPANVLHDGSDDALGVLPNGASRFFYCAKAGEDDRYASKHPTVKPVALMQWLVRLVTPPGGLVLDPFAGSGSTGVACMREGFRAILCELEAASVADIVARVEGESHGRVFRAAEKAKRKGKEIPDLPLFA